MYTEVFCHNNHYPIANRYAHDNIAQLPEPCNYLPMLQEDRTVFSLSNQAHPQSPLQRDSNHFIPR